MLSQLSPWFRYIRARARRSRSMRWAWAAAVAVGVGTWVNSVTAGAEARAQRFGQLVEVAVAARPVATGTVLETDDIEWRQVPRAFLPHSAPVRNPVGRVAIADLLAGEAVVAGRVAPAGLHGPAALLPRHHKAIAVERSTTTPRLSLGDRVDLLATFPPELSGDGDPTFPVARHARVIDVGSESVTVAVTAAEATRVAYAIAAGTVTLVMTGPSD